MGSMLLVSLIFSHLLGSVLQDMIDNFLKTVKNIHSISLLQKKSASTTGVEACLFVLVITNKEILCRRLTFKILIMFAVPIPVEASAQIAIRQYDCCDCHCPH